MPKEVFISKSPPRYVLNIAGVTLPELTHEDVEHLINVLMLEFPGVSGALREIWNKRERATAEITSLFVADGFGHVVYSSQYHLTIHLAGMKLHKTGSWMDMLDELDAHGISYPAEEVKDDPVSKRVAEEEAKRQVVSLFLEKHSLTADQLLEKLKLGEITEITI